MVNFFLVFYMLSLFLPPGELKPTGPTNLDFMCAIYLFKKKNNFCGFFFFFCVIHHCYVVWFEIYIYYVGVTN
ncbi:hypothetical protein H5410_025836 [Solanum commersonii]|uniref:Secreted protein n=1 Tax=Solanum commersonii TaxID=4109 RepID=A0A9J5YX05_SOLCO|nr:hypothetical protein H5410_025836 [Solanum commersonii]